MKAKVISEFYDRENETYRSEKDKEAFEVDEERLAILMSAGVVKEVKEAKTTKATETEKKG